MIEDYEKIGTCIIKNGKYYVTPDSSGQGLIFKDAQRFEEDKDEPCYCPEYALEEENRQTDGSYIVDRTSLYSHNDIEELCNEFISDNPDIKVHDTEHLTQMVFEEIDWQFPETYIGTLNEILEEVY